MGPGLYVQAQPPAEARATEMGCRNQLAVGCGTLDCKSRVEGLAINRNDEIRSSIHEMKNTGAGYMDAEGPKDAEGATDALQEQIKAALAAHRRNVRKRKADDPDSNPADSDATKQACKYLAMQSKDAPPSGITRETLMEVRTNALMLGDAGAGVVAEVDARMQVDAPPPNAKLRKHFERIFGRRNAVVM